MIKELVQFSNLLDDEFKVQGTKPKIGIHILLPIEKKGGEAYLDVGNFEYKRFGKKTVPDGFLEQCKMYQINAWCIDTNKCFDLPTKAIHSCSPFCVAFKREHLEGGIKYKANEGKGKKQIQERFLSYFEKTSELFESINEREQYKVFEAFFTQEDSAGYFEKVIKKIEGQFEEKRLELELELASLKENLAKAPKEDQKALKDKIANINTKLVSVAPIDDGEYFIFYLGLPLEKPLEKYKEVHKKYLSDKLFNSDKYNTKPDEEGLIYGTSNFLNGFNVSKPFLMHKTASFDITGRISNQEALKLYEFQQVLGLNTLPNPLPIFIYKEELNGEMIAIFRESEERLRYGEIIKKLYKSHKSDLENYYLLYSQNTKEGLVFKDFDFVSKFEYNLKSSKTKDQDFWEVAPLFTEKYVPRIHNIFEFQNQILPVIFNNNFIVRTKEGKVIVKYFGEIKQEFCKSGPNYLNVVKYRKAFYDFVYKSQRKAITQKMFDDMMQVSILEDIRLDKIVEVKKKQSNKELTEEDFNKKHKLHSENKNIRKKLNIWFSLKEEFINNTKNKNEETMASKLKSYHQFMENLVTGKVDIDGVNNEQFAYATGQLISYISSSSKSENKTYRYLEPYLQSTNSKRIKDILYKDFKRYKHDIYKGSDVELNEEGGKKYVLTRFQRVAEFVMTYDVEEKLDAYLPVLLAGIFGDNKIFKPKEQATEKKESN